MSTGAEMPGASGRGAAILSEDRLRDLLTGAQLDAETQTSTRYKREAEQMVSILTELLSLRSDAHTNGEVKVDDWVTAARTFLSPDDFEAIQSLASAFAVDRAAGVNSQLKPAGQS